MSAGDRDYEALKERQARWKSGQLQIRIDTLRSMASGRFLYEPSEIERARRILERWAELQATGLPREAALKQADSEHPAPPPRNLDVYKQMGGRE